MMAVPYMLVAVPGRARSQISSKTVAGQRQPKLVKGLLKPGQTYYEPKAGPYAIGLQFFN